MTKKELKAILKKNNYYKITFKSEGTTNISYYEYLGYNDVGDIVFGKKGFPLIVCATDRIVDIEQITIEDNYFFRLPLKVQIQIARGIYYSENKEV
jgi:hypothetical protein